MARDSGTGESRRTFRPARKHRWPIELQPIESMGGRPARVEAVTYGVSVGGAFIETDWSPAVGLGMHVWLRPLVEDPRPPVLRLRAEVRWVSDGVRRDVPRGFGIAFRALTAADEVALHGYFSSAHKVV
jgi:hypothetical protein